MPVVPFSSALIASAALVIWLSPPTLKAQVNAAEASALASSHAAWTAPLSCPMAKAGWRAERFEGRAPNRLICKRGALQINSQNSVSLHHIRPPDRLRKARRLAWEWRVQRSGGASALTHRGKDDRDIAVMVAFRYNPGAASLEERLLRPLVQARQGADAPGRVLAYTWAGGDAAEHGAAQSKPGPARMLRSPFGGAAHRIIVLRQGPGDWRSESIDLARDYNRAFGDDAFEIQHVAIVSDTDDLGGEAKAAIRDLRLER